MNKIVLIISILLSLLSLLYMILCYVNITRYLTLYCKSSESYAKSYSLLDKAHKQSRVVISVGIKSCVVLKKIKPLINSLLDQNVKVNEIAFNISSICNVPDKLKRYVNIHKTNDKEKILIPTLFRERIADTFIFILNPDYIYPDTFISDMLDLYTNEKENCFIFNNQSKTILTQIKYFNPDFIDTYNNDSKLNDSKIINYLKSQNLKQIDYNCIGIYKRF